MSYGYVLLFTHVREITQAAASRSLEGLLAHTISSSRLKTMERTSKVNSSELKWKETKMSVSQAFIPNIQDDHIPRFIWRDELS